MKQITLYGPGHGPSFFVDDDTADQLQEDFTKGHDLKITSFNKTKTILVKGANCWAMEQSQSMPDDDESLEKFASKVE